MVLYCEKIHGSRSSLKKQAEDKGLVRKPKPAKQSLDAEAHFNRISNQIKNAEANHAFSPSPRSRRPMSQLTSNLPGPAKNSMQRTPSSKNLPAKSNFDKFEALTAEAFAKAFEENKMKMNALLKKKEEMKDNFECEAEAVEKKRKALVRQVLAEKEALKVDQGKEHSTPKSSSPPSTAPSTPRTQDKQELVAQEQAVEQAQACSPDVMPCELLTGTVCELVPTSLIKDQEQRITELELELSAAVDMAREGFVQSQKDAATIKEQKDIISALEWDLSTARSRGKETVQECGQVAEAIRERDELILELQSQLFEREQCSAVKQQAYDKWQAACQETQKAADDRIEALEREVEELRKMNPREHSILEKLRGA